MIRIDKQTNKITTDCKTVGEFMTEAAAIFDYCVIIVDGCRYEFSETPKVRVTDSTPIGSIAMADNGDIVITAKPLPKSVKKAGWVNIYNQKTHYRAGRIFDTQEQAKEFELSGSVATARVEWEEEVEK